MEYDVIRFEAILAQPLSLELFNMLILRFYDLMERLFPGTTTEDIWKLIDMKGNSHLIQISLSPIGDESFKMHMIHTYNILGFRLYKGENLLLPQYMVLRVQNLCELLLYPEIKSFRFVTAENVFTITQANITRWQTDTEKNDT